MSVLLAALKKQKSIQLYLLMLELAFTIGIVVNRSWATHVMVPKMVGETRRYLPSNDPKWDKAAPPLIVKDASDHEIDLAQPSSQPQMIVFFSNCRQCSLPYIRSVSLFQKSVPGIQVRAVFPEDLSSIRAFLQQFNLSLSYYKEYYADTESNYNVAWFPRVYVVSKDGTLAYAQSPMTTFADALKSAKGFAAR